MKGLIVNGFTVVETLGSGHGGLLYLARDERTGREAVIRVARTGEDSLSVRVFVEEAQRLLPDAANAETAVARDGTPVLMALGPPSPGSGVTQHSTTDRLPLDSSQAPRLPEEPVPTRVSRVWLLPLMLLVAAFSAAVVLGFGRQPPPAPTVEPKLPTQVVQPKVPTPVALPSTPLDEPAAHEAHPPPAVRIAPPKQPAPSKPQCEVTPVWRRTLHLNLAELEEVSKIDPLELATEVKKLGREIDDALSSADCARVNARFEALKRRALE